MSVSVAALQPSAVVFREEQNFGWWVYALVVGCGLVGPVPLFWLLQKGPEPVSATGLVVPLFILGGLAAPLLLMVGLLRLTTEVTPTDVRVWFGWVPTYRKFVPIGSVQKLEVVTYRPLRDYGGWGVRFGRDGERALNARGNRGVRLELTDGTRLMIGSQQPETLALAIEGALRPGG